MSRTDPNHPAPIPNLLTSRELAALLGCSERHVYVMRKQGLPTIRLGALVRFDPEQVRRWIDGNGGTPDDERARQLADVAATGDEDNAQCAATDLAREFPLPRAGHNAESRECPPAAIGARPFDPTS